MVKVNSCVFISGNGSNLKNLIMRSRGYNFPINISLVVSNKTDAYGLNYAKKYAIPLVVVNTKSRNYEYQILNLLKKYKISLICLAGYMKIISKSFLRNFRNKVINIHPSLLPKFKGLNTYSRIIKNKEKKTGCTVHYVDEKLDNGNIIVKKIFFINPKDDEKILKKKTQTLEYKTFPEAIIRIYRKN